MQVRIRVFRKPHGHHGQTFGIRRYILYRLRYVIVDARAIHDLRMYAYTAVVQFAQLPGYVGNGRFLPARTQHVRPQYGIGRMYAYVQGRKPQANDTRKFSVGYVRQRHVVSEDKTVPIIVVFYAQCTAQFLGRQLIHKTKQAMIATRPHRDFAAQFQAEILVVVLFDLVIHHLGIRADPHGKILAAVVVIVVQYVQHGIAVERDQVFARAYSQFRRYAVFCYRKNFHTLIIVP